MSTQQTNAKNANKKRSKKKAFHEARRKDGLREILASPVARYYLWALLDWVQPLGNANTVSMIADGGTLVAGPHDPYATAAKNAVQVIGVSVLNDITEVKPEAILEYLSERQPPVQDEELQEETEDDS